MRTKFLLLCMLTAVFTVAGSAKATVILPTGVDEYRIIFVTAGAFWADPSAIGWYNDQVASEAATNAVLDALGADWYCVGSTASVDARDNISPGIAWDAENVPIYNTAGELVGNNLADIFDSSLLAPVWYNQHGSATGSAYTWTGSEADGTAGDFDRTLGAWPSANVGNPGASGVVWIDYSVRSVVESWPLYGISAPVPEPATVCLLGLGGLALLRRSGRRLNS